MAPYILQNSGTASSKDLIEAIMGIATHFMAKVLLRTAVVGEELSDSTYQNSHTYTMVEIANFCPKNMRYLLTKLVDC